MKTKI